MKINIKVPHDHHPPPPRNVLPLRQKELQIKYIAGSTSRCR